MVVIHIHVSCFHNWHGKARAVSIFTDVKALKKFRMKKNEVLKVFKQDYSSSEEIPSDSFRAEDDQQFKNNFLTYSMEQHA